MNVILSHYCVIKLHSYIQEQGKRPLGRPRRRWEDNSKTGIQQIGGEDADWIALVQDEDKRGNM